MVTASKEKVILSLIAKSEDSASTDSERYSTRIMAQKLMMKNNITEDMFKPIPETKKITGWSFVVSENIVNNKIFLNLTQKYSTIYNPTTHTFSSNDYALMTEIRDVCHVINTTMRFEEMTQLRKEQLESAKRAHNEWLDKTSKKTARKNNVTLFQLFCWGATIFILIIIAAG